jgi:hypothetical protein
MVTIGQEYNGKHVFSSHIIHPAWCIGGFSQGGAGSLWPYYKTLDLLFSQCQISKAICPWAGL